MYNMSKYLYTLRDKIFKILPLREEHDRGEDNHLEEYLNYLCANFSGAFACYPALTDLEDLAEACNNLSFLRENIDLPFNKWRSLTLRTTKLINRAASKIEEVEHA